MKDEKFVVTPKQMKIAEENSERMGVSCAVLMENVGEKIAYMTDKLYGVRGKKVAVLCGSGNNGGDGFAAAKHLFCKGAAPHVVIVSDMPKTELSKNSFERNKSRFASLREYLSDAGAVGKIIKDADFIIDCVYGTGFHGELDKKIKSLFKICAESNAIKISVDIASGCCALDGKAASGAFSADVTFALGAIKTGQLYPPTSTFSGELMLLDIGVTTECYSEYTAVLNDDKLFSLLPARNRITHKGDYGRLLNIAGSENYIGAAWLSANAAIKTGTGIVTLCSTKTVTRATAATLHECVYLPSCRDGDCLTSEDIPAITAAAASANAVIAGCGMGRSKDTYNIIKSVLETADCPVIIDADGINSICGHRIKRKDNNTILLTPHPAEFARLSGLEVRSILENKLTAASEFAKQNSVYVLLKDAYSVLAAPDGRLAVNITGNAGLAKGGSGDTLSGTIGGFAAQGVDIWNAARLGAYIFGLAAEELARRYDISGILPSEIPSVYPYIIRR